MIVQQWGLQLTFNHQRLQFIEHCSTVLTTRVCFKATGRMVGGGGWQLGQNVPVPWLSGALTEFPEKIIKKKIESYTFNLAIIFMGCFQCFVMLLTFFCSLRGKGHITLLNIVGWFILHEIYACYLLVSSDKLIFNNYLLCNF